MCDLQLTRIIIRTIDLRGPLAHIEAPGSVSVRPPLAAALLLPLAAAVEKSGLECGWVRKLLAEQPPHLPVFLHANDTRRLGTFAFRSHAHRELQSHSKVGHRPACQIQLDAS